MQLFNQIRSRENLIKQLVKYAGVGGLATLVEWGTFNCLLKFNLHYLTAVIIAFFLAAGVNYRLCRRYVFFSGPHQLYMEATLLYLVSAVGLAMNILLMWLMVGLLALPPFTSKVLATGMVFIWNFTSRKIWVFGPGLTRRQDKGGKQHSLNKTP